MEAYDLGLRLKALREHNKLTQEEAGQRIGKSRSAIQGYEATTTAPSIKTLKKLALLYRTSTDYILGITNDMYYRKDGLTANEQAFVFEMADNLHKFLIENKKDD